MDNLDIPQDEKKSTGASQRADDTSVTIADGTTVNPATVDQQIGSARRSRDRPLTVPASGVPETQAQDFAHGRGRFTYGTRSAEGSLRRSGTTVGSITTIPPTTAAVGVEGVSEGERGDNEKTLLEEQEEEEKVKEKEKEDGGVVVGAEKKTKKRDKGGEEGECMCEGHGEHEHEHGHGQGRGGKLKDMVRNMLGVSVYGDEGEEEVEGKKKKGKGGKGVDDTGKSVYSKQK